MEMGVYEMIREVGFKMVRATRGVPRAMEQVVVMNMMMGNTRIRQGGMDKMVWNAAVLNKMVVGEVMMLLEWEVLIRLMR